MESRAKILGHPIHQMLIPFPLGLLATSVIFDVVYLASDAPAIATSTFWILAAGIVGGLLAAPFGWIDWFAIPRGTRAKAIGLTHGLGNVLVLVLFAASWWLRRESAVETVPHHPDDVALVCSFAGFALAAVTGWLGGELVDRLGVGVDDGAHLDAPSSLTGRPAGQHR